MKQFLLVLIFVAALATAKPTPSEVQRETEAKLEELLTKSRQSGGYMSFHSGEMERFLASGPRNYSVFMLATTSSSSCVPCQELKTDLLYVSSVYESARYNRSSLSASLPLSAQAKHTIFFVEFNAARDHQFFSSMGLSTIPHFYFISPSKSSRQKPWAMVLKEEIGLMSDAKLDAIIKNVNRRTNFEIEIAPPPERVDWFAVVFRLMLIVALVAISCTVGLPYLRMLANKYVFLIIGCLFYAFCASGGMFNQIRNTPLSGPDSLISTSNGWQFISESWIVGGLFLLCGGIFIMLNTIPHSFTLSKWQRNVLVGGGIAAFFFLWTQLLKVYTIKNGAYRMGWVWANQW